MALPRETDRTAPPRAKFWPQMAQESGLGDTNGLPNQYAGDLTDKSPKWVCRHLRRRDLGDVRSSLAIFRADAEGFWDMSGLTESSFFRHPELAGRPLLRRWGGKRSSTYDGGVDQRLYVVELCCRKAMPTGRLYHDRGPDSSRSRGAAGGYTVGRSLFQDGDHSNINWVVLALTLASSCTWLWVSLR